MSILIVRHIQFDIQSFPYILIRLTVNILHCDAIHNTQIVLFVREFQMAQAQIMQIEVIEIELSVF